MCSLIPLYLVFLNRRHAKRREQLGKSAQLVDESMVNKNELVGSKAVESDDGANRPQRTLEEDNALQDMTDLRNEDFIYVY